MILEFALAALCSFDPHLAFDPRLTALFTPLHPRLGEYAVCTARQSFDATIAHARDAGVHLGTPELVAAADAFGAAGFYDRGALSRLYASQRPRVARGWREQDGTFESVTVISPYPNAELTELNNGTLVLRWELRTPSRF